MDRRRGHALHRQGRKHASAPGALRRRVIANVRHDQAPLAELSHKMRRRLPAPGRTPLTLVTLLAGCVLVAVLLLDTGSASHPDGAVISTIPGAQASLRPAGGDTELRLSGMPQPRAKMIYEVWLLRPQEHARPIDDMFTVTHGGHAIVDLPGHLNGVREVMLTEEPIGGSDSPTGQVLLRVVHPSALARG